MKRIRLIFTEKEGYKLIPTDIWLFYPENGLTPQKQIEYIERLYENNKESHIMGFEMKTVSPYIFKAVEVYFKDWEIIYNNGKEDCDAEEIYKSMSMPMCKLNFLS